MSHTSELPINHFSSPEVSNDNSLHSACYWPPLYTSFSSYHNVSNYATVAFDGCIVEAF